MRVVVYRSVFGGRLGISPLEQGIIEGENPVHDPELFTMWYTFEESGCLGMQPKMGGKCHLKLNIGERPIANKYREGKMKRTLKRELNSTWNCWKGNVWNQRCLRVITSGALTCRQVSVSFGRRKKNQGNVASSGECYSPGLYGGWDWGLQSKHFAWRPVRWG